MTPIENARCLVGILAEFFPAGSNSGDLRERFRQVADRKHATFFAALSLARAKGWVVREGKIYTLNPNGCWREPAIKPPNRAEIGEELARHQFEHVLEMRAERIERLEAVNRRLVSSKKAVVAGEVAGPAIGTLVQLMIDSSIPIRARLQAAQNLLEFKTPTAVMESAKLFLAALSSDSEQNVDYRLAALAALRKSEDPRIAPSVERPSPPARFDTPAEIAERSARHRAHIERQAALDQERLAQERSSPRLPRLD
jgi:hypothetical protein